MKAGLMYKMNRESHQVLLWRWNYEKMELECLGKVGGIMTAEEVRELFGIRGKYVFAINRKNALRKLGLTDKEKKIKKPMNRYDYTRKNGTASTRTATESRA